jgi:hypothetical protein
MMTSLVMLPLVLENSLVQKRSPKVTDSDVRGDLYEHVDMIFRQCAVDDGDAHFGAALLDDVATPEANPSTEHLEAILRCPNNVIAVVIKRATAGAVTHSLYPRKKETYASGPFLFSEDTDYSPRIRLKPLPD